MPINVQCACGKSHQVEDHYAGFKTKCPACQAVLTVPRVLAAVAAPAGGSTAPALPAQTAPVFGPAPFQTDQIHALDRAVFQGALNKSFRSVATISIIFGAINTAVGIMALDDHPVNIVLVLLGLGMLAEGVILLMKPNATGLILEGVAFSALGIWNLFILLFNASNGDPGSNAGRTGVWAIIQIAFGIQNFMRYGPTKERLAGPPLDAPMLEQGKALVDQAHKVDPKKTPNAVSFTATNFFGAKIWKGLLWQGSGLAVETRGTEAMIFAPDELIIVEAKPSGKKNQKALLRIGRKQFKTMMTNESYQRIADWKSTAETLVEPLA